MIQNTASIEKNILISGPKTFFRFLGSVMISIWGGALMGAIVAIVGSFIYIVFLFPLAMGFAGGSVVKSAIQMAKTRKNSHLIFLSFLVAISIYGTYHYGRYIALQVQMYVEVASSLSERTSNTSLELGKAFVDHALEEETGHSGFVGYMLYKAKQGVALGRLVSSNRTNLGPVLTWVYWMLEFGIILWVTATIGRKEILVPVCDSCGNRYGKEKHLGGMSIDNKSVLLDLIGRRDFLEVGKLLEENADLPSIELYMKSCESCEKGVSHLTVQQAAQGPKGSVQFSDILKVTLQPRDRLALSQKLTLSN